MVRDSARALPGEAFGATARRSPVRVRRDASERDSRPRGGSATKL
jgi:hypothetical protein